MKLEDDFDDCLMGWGVVDYKRVAWDLQDLDGMLTTDWECPTFCSPWSSRWWGCRWMTVRFYRICTICTWEEPPTSPWYPDNWCTGSPCFNTVLEKCSSGFMISESIQLHQKHSNVLIFLYLWCILSRRLSSSSCIMGGAYILGQFW